MDGLESECHSPDVAGKLGAQAAVWGPSLGLQIGTWVRSFGASPRRELCSGVWGVRFPSSKVTNLGKELAEFTW